MRFDRTGAIDGSASEAARLIKRNRVPLHTKRAPAKRLPQNCKYCGGFNGQHRLPGGETSDRVVCNRCGQYRCPLNLLAEGCTVCEYVIGKRAAGASA